MFRCLWPEKFPAFLPAVFILIAFMANPARADQTGDWPMWRRDAAHTAATPHALPAALSLNWTLDLGRPEPAWPWTQDKLQFDAAAEPVVLGDTIFVPSSRTDSLAAYDIGSGKMRWRFFAQGPVRLAPVAADGRVWFGSDDGCVYCLDAATGAPAWKFRAVPSEHKTLGNERAASTWPVRGGPVLHAGRLYFAAGIWPSMGIYIYALDAATGKVVWLNSGEGSVWQDQPHAPPAKSFSGVGPQGCLAVAGDRLLVPSGRAVPGAFDLATGRFLYARFADRLPGKAAGGHAVGVAGNFFFCGPGHNRPSEFGNSPGIFDLASGKALKATRATVLTTGTAYQFEKETLQGLDISSAGLIVRWSLKIPGCTEVFCKAGDRLYCGGQQKIVAIDDGAPAPAWEKSIAGTPASCIAARGRLFVSTLEGKLYCFGEGAEAKSIEIRKEEHVASGGSDLLTLGERDGYCIVAGVRESKEIEELVGQSRLRVIGLTVDTEIARKMRERWAGLGIPFSRASILEGTIETAQLPPYLANLIVWQSAAPSTKTLAAIFRSLRPYGGKACFTKLSKETMEYAAKEAGLEGFSVKVRAAARTTNEWTVLERIGPLPGAGSWTHNYGDAANSVFSPDRLAKAPLGILWYGGNDHTIVLPRHGHGPTEQVIGGRLIIEGPDHLSARDVYTGRPLWERALPGVGAHFDNTAHEAGANHMGSNYASAEDGIYVAHGMQGLRLDPATGETITTFTLKSPAGQPLEFAQFKLAGYLAVVSAGPHGYDETIAGTSKSWNRTGSRFLFVMDRRSGRILWQRKAESLFHHNTVIVGGDAVFAIDRLAPTPAALARRGQEATSYTLLALGLRDGGVKWKTQERVFGTWLGYSAERGVLIQSGRRSRDMGFGEPGGRIMALNATTGKALWDRTEKVSDGPYILYHDMLIMQDSAGGWGVELATGKDVMRPHPITGLPVRWQFSRRYGCNTALASENLLTFRSGAIGYYDMATLDGTANFGGVKSGCSPCLIAADGIVSAPDYTRTCLCAYPNQCSLALVHMPEMETWTFGGWAKPAGAAIARLGINFGAAGDRADTSGTLWVDFPSIGFDSPDPQVKVEPVETTWFRADSRSECELQLVPRWITASGALGARKITVKVNNPAPRPYTVRLYFAEPQGAAAGQRVFNVALQGRRVLEGLDIAREAGGSGGGIVREFKNIQAGEIMEVAFDPAPGAAIQEPVICGMELIAE